MGVEALKEQGCKEATLWVLKDTNAKERLVLVFFMKVRLERDWVKKTESQDETLT